MTGAALAGLLVLLVGGVAVLYLLRGRDARVVGKKAAEGDHAPLAGAEFEPPDGVRPGQIGTLIDEQADVIDVTATIVDLAVRGYLLIEEEDRARTGRLDWTLRRLDRPQADLLPYERILLDALLTAPDGSGRDAVKLSELGGTFATKLAQVRSAMYDDVVKQGWFARRPDTVRSRWTVTGILVTLLGIAGTVALAFTTEWALAGLALIIAGAALAYGGQYMPAKTARGATVLAHTIGFRAFLERGVIPEGEGTASRQRIALFSRLLPYAVVFDAVPKWAQTVKDAGSGPRAPTTCTGTRARPNGTCRSSPSRCARSCWPRRDRSRSRAGSEAAGGHRTVNRLTPGIGGGEEVRAPCQPLPCSPTTPPGSGTPCSWPSARPSSS